MAELARIQFKRTFDKGKKPTAESLDSGELAINLADRYIFTKDGSGAVINLSNPPVYEGDVAFTGLVKGQKAILGKTADYSSYEAQRDLSKFGAFRTNQMDDFDSLILNVPHPSASLGNYAHGRGFEFNYGHLGNKVFTYGFNANGEKAYKFRMYHEGDKPSPSELNVYSKQESNNTFATKTMVDRTGGDTYIRNVNNTKWLALTDDGSMSLYDNSTKKRTAYIHTGGSMHLYGSNNFTGITLIKGDGYKVRMETSDHSATSILAFAYRDSADRNQYVVSIPKENSILATQNWVDGKYYKRNDSPSFKYYIDLYHNTDSTRRVQFSYETNNDVLWTIKDGSSTIAVKHPRERGTLATREWSDTRYVRVDQTNLGKQYTPATTIASGQWGKPIGYSTMTHPNTANKPSGVSSYGYWHVIGARDQSNGYSGIWAEHGGGKMFYGQASSAGTNPSWYKIYTEAQKPTPDEIGAVNLGKGGVIRLHSYGLGKHGYSAWYENNVRQAYIGYGSDGSKEFTISNEKGSSGTINLKAGNVLVNGNTIASQNWCNSNYYTKAQTYERGILWTRNECDERYVKRGARNIKSVTGRWDIDSVITIPADLRGQVINIVRADNSWNTAGDTACPQQAVMCPLINGYSEADLAGGEDWVQFKFEYATNQTKITVWRGAWARIKAIYYRD
ncbi:TPA: hypothetical protein SMP26_001873 [Proteus mirabilis]|nr:hypothetical protein [Proteus mirabilis]